MEKFYGEKGIQLIAESHSKAIDHIEQIVGEEGIVCDFERVDGFLFVPEAESADLLEREAALVKKLGKECLSLSQTPFPSFKTGPALQFPEQAQFHILKYLAGLLKALSRYPCQIFTHSAVQDIQDGSPFSLKTAAGATVSAKNVIVASSMPINNRFFIHTKQAPYRTYVITGTVPKNAFPKGFYWDTLDP